MAIWYVRSSAVGTGAGTSWANAATTLQAALTLGAAGDTYYVSEDHAGTSSSTLTITFKGTAAAIDRVICVNHSGTVPPVSADLRTTASITTTGNTNIVLTGGYAYIQGIKFNLGTGTNAPTFNMGGMPWLYLKNCAIAKISTTAGAFAQYLGANTQSNYLVWDNTTLQSGATGDSIGFRECHFIWKNTPSAIQGATISTGLINSINPGWALIDLDGVDFSAMGSGGILVNASPSGQIVNITNCKLGASLTIAGVPTSPNSGQINVLISDSGTQQYRQERYTYHATLTSEIVVVPTLQQASDGTTALTWKIVTTANNSAVAPFETFTYGEWIDSVGSPITRTFEIINDATTLTNAEVWAEAQYLGSSATPVASLASSGPADILAAGSSLTTSGAAWTTTGITTPVAQQVAVTFTPQMKGYVRIVFKVARASKTLWINPRPNEV